MEVALRIENLKKSYHGRTVLDIPALALEKGRRYALIGPNGSGKSTLLRLIAGTLAPDAGQVACHAAHMGYMPQKPYSFGFSVQRNVELAVRDKAMAPKETSRALELLGLSALAEARGSRLSGGEAQRMAFARMIVNPNELLLLDEPTAAADVAGLALMQDILLDYCEKTRCTLLFTTHTPALAARCADTVILLDHGRIAEMGEADAVLRAPQSETAKNFLAHWRL